MSDETRSRSEWLERMIRIGWLAPVLSILVFIGALALGPRGSSEWGVWMAQATDHVLAWLQGPAMFSLGAVDEAWKHQAALPPLPILTTALVRLIRPDLGFFQAAHIISCLGLALTIPLVWGLGRRCGGPPAAATAVLAFVFTPRILGLGGQAGFGTAAVFGLVFCVYAMYRARTSRAWAIASPLAFAVGILTAHTTLLALAPWLLLTLSDKGQISTLLVKRGRDPQAPDGFFRTTSFSPWLLLVLLGPLLAVALYPWTWLAPIDRMLSYLQHFIVHAKEPYLFMGDRIAAERLPVTGGLIFALVTLTPVTCLMGVAGIIGEILLKPLRATRAWEKLAPYADLAPDPEAAGPESREAKRWVFGFLLFTLTLPWLMGGPVFGVVDLIAMIVPFWAVFAGCALSRLFSVTAEAVRKRQAALKVRLPVSLALATFGVLVFVPSIIDCARYYPVAEGYYSWIIGGPEGAAAQGMPRYPHGPLPADVARHLAAQNRASGGKTTMAVVVDDKRTRKILDAYRHRGFVKDLPRWADRYRADILFLPHHDADPDYYRSAPQFSATISPQRSTVLRSGQIRLFTLGQTPTKESP